MQGLGQSLGFRVSGFGFRVQQLQFEQFLIELVTPVSEIIPPTQESHNSETLGPKSRKGRLNGALSPEPGTEPLKEP